MLRTHTCGEIKASDAGKEVKICGWVQVVRDHGGLLFLDLRDRYGITQVSVRPEMDAIARRAGEIALEGERNPSMRRSRHKAQRGSE